MKTNLYIFALVIISNIANGSEIYGPFLVISKIGHSNATIRLFNTTTNDIFLEIPSIGVVEHSIYYENFYDESGTGRRAGYEKRLFKVLNKGHSNGRFTISSMHEIIIPLESEEIVEHIQLYIHYVYWHEILNVKQLDDLDPLLQENSLTIIIKNNNKKQL